MHRVRVVAAMVGLLVLGGLLVQAPRSQAQPSGAQTWDVQVGGDPPNSSLTTDAFWPSSITIHVGDTVRWTFPDSVGQHTVSFQAGKPAQAAYVPGPGDGEYTLGPAWYPLGPSGPNAPFDGSQFINSGAPLTSGDSFPFTLTFSKTGNFVFVCQLHAGMTSSVEVLPAGSVLAETPADAQARGQGQFRTRTNNIGIFTLNPSQPAVPIGNAQASAGSAVVHTVTAAVNFPGGVSALQYMPGDLTVRQGDVVVWTNADTFDRHTVTFTSGATPPDYPEVRVQSTGPLFVLGASAANPTGGTSYDGSSYVNSGVLPPGASTAMTINAPPGTYQYICLIHRGVMKGTITVTQ